MKNVWSFTILSTILILCETQIGECNPRCYFCDSVSNPDCIHPRDHKMSTNQCTPVNVGEMKVAIDKQEVSQLVKYFDVELHQTDFSVPLSCIKTVIKLHDKEMTFRGCQLAPKDNIDLCKKIIDEREDIVKHCSFCNENGCNTAPLKSIPLTFIALVLPLLIVI
ncbi:hypothetical protein RI129_010484 [Pyrocoelia pectoralis]|uniref:Protein sleepless n=1 Tax=Pyrocoelia pectoralis TaxID=417401 RepID=A0AAN7V6T4_9COLE